MCGLYSAKKSWGRLPSPSAPSSTPRLDFCLRSSGHLSDLWTTSSSGVVAPLNPHPGPSRSPAPSFGWEKTPTPGNSRRRPCCPAHARCQVNPAPPSPVRGRVRGPQSWAGARPSPARDLQSPLGSARSNPDAAGAGASPRAPGLPWSPPGPCEPRLKGEEAAARHLRAASDPSSRAAARSSAGCCKEALCLVLGTGWA